MTAWTDDEIRTLNARFSGATLSDVLAWATEQFSDGLRVASSLGLEDVVIVHALSQRKEAGETIPRVFMLDTGRMHQETYDLYERLTARYSIPIELKFPWHAAVEDLVQRKGTNSFFNSVEDRKECCAVRKIEPLRRALHGATAWITGLRRSQSQSRSEVALIERDGDRIKINPLVAWSEESVWQYVRQYEVPYNKLHDRGFPSIGCAPCTRAISPGEDVRAGRWWWEDAGLKECGLHVQPPQPPAQIIGPPESRIIR